jgi:hypothetical protein
MKQSFGVIVLATVLLAIPRQGTAAGPLETAVWDGGDEISTTRIAAAGARVVHLVLDWRAVAPTTRPPGFDADDPDDPAYRWSQFDRRLARVTRQGLRPLVAVYRAPSWAEGNGHGPAGTIRPDPAQLNAFAKAAALRYSGSFEGHPRVANWQLWLEQNLFFHLNPQREGGRALSPIWYREMLNAFADAIHSVHRDNLVVTGGLAPFTTHTGHQRQWGLAPLHFMRVMLCMGKNLKPTCRARSRFDVWAHHPYTSGGPNHHAHLPDDVSLGDLPEMKRMLDAAVRARIVLSPHPVRFWVTEFGWDSSPPDPRGVPARLHARWVAEALYRMWRSGITLVTWNKLRDDPINVSLYQSGLFYRGSTIESDRPKPALRAFRFPFVALPGRGRGTVWGRTPTSRSEAVLVQRRSRRGWIRVAVLRANRYGIFRARLRAPKRSYLRARIFSNGETSLAFRVVKTRDRPMFAFGTLPG